MNIADRTINAIQTDTEKHSQGTADNLLYTINYAPLLQSATITASTWSGSGVAIADAAHTTTSTSAKLTAGAGTYTVKNVITTSIGETHQRVIRLTVKGDERSEDYE